VEAKKRLEALGLQRAAAAIGSLGGSLTELAPPGDGGNDGVPVL